MPLQGNVTKINRFPKLINNNNNSSFQNKYLKIRHFYYTFSSYISLVTLPSELYTFVEGNKSNYTYNITSPYGLINMKVH